MATPRGGGEGVEGGRESGHGWEGREGKEGRERSRWRRLSIDGRLNNSKASCPAIFKRRAPTCACGRNPWSNSASPNKCILLMEEREGAGGGKRDAFTSRILYIQLSRNREFLDRRSSTDRKIEGKRSSLKKKKKKGKSFFFPSHVILPLFIQRFRFIQLLNRFVAYSEIIVSWMRFVHRDKSSFSRRRRIIYRNFSIVIHFEFQQEKIKRNYIPSYGILFNIFFSNTNVKY